jgi:hypothetical protein
MHASQKLDIGDRQQRQPLIDVSSPKTELAADPDMGDPHGCLPRRHLVDGTDRNLQIRRHGRDVPQSHGSKLGSIPGSRDPMDIRPVLSNLGLVLHVAVSDLMPIRPILLNGFHDLASYGPSDLLDRSW